MRKLFGAAAAASVLISSAAWATVTFDSSTGFGFVGKGDVQLAFHWNNAVSQAQTNNVVFEYDSSDTYEVTCDWTTGPSSNPTTHEINVPKHVTVNDTVAYDARQRNQYTGYNLNGFGSTSGGGTVPQVGDTCPGNSALGFVTAVSDGPISSSGGLYVSDPTLGLGPVQIY